MADEVTITAYTETIYASQITEMVKEELRPRNVMRGLVVEASVSGSNSYDWTSNDDPGAAATVAEATDLANTALTTDRVRATVGTIGIMASPTDEATHSSIINVMSNVSSVLSRSVLEKFETDLAALLDDTTNATATSGVDLTVDTFLAAVAALVERDVPGPYVAVGSPTQTTDLQRDIAASTASVYSSADEGKQAFNLSDDGFQLRIGRIPIYQTSTVPTANAGADDVMGIFNPNLSLHLAVTAGWDLPRIRLERNESLRTTEVVATARYGVVAGRASDAQELDSDA